MARPTPVFTARSREGAEALAKAQADGEALEAVGRRTRFGCGAIVGAVMGLFIVSNMWETDPTVRAWLDGTDVAGFWFLVGAFAVAVGLASIRWGTKAWTFLHDLWAETYTRS